MATPPSLTRRRALALSGTAAGGLLLAGGDPAGAAHRPRRQRGKLPRKRIEEIVRAEGTLSSGVLGISIGRDDIGDVKGGMGVTFNAAFHVHGDLDFQPLGGGDAFLNGDLALKPEEIQPVVDALLKAGLAFQAFHQHYFDWSPQVWFIHFRGVGDAVALAHKVRSVLDVTSAPFPQTMPSDPTTPLDSKRLGRILGGSAEIGEEGVVMASVSRGDRIVVGEVVASPEANISTTVEIKPLDAAGTSAAVAPDLSLRADEVRPALRAMRRHGFEVGCLYNQETAEHPQLYFAHMLATGDPYDLARKLRATLDKTRAEKA
ncbi:MAG: DUF1259 domain-containing protein [Solirubrobacteraceae bacterium]